MSNALTQWLEERYDQMVDLRHHLHKHPEISTQESQTSALLKEKAKDLGLEIYEVEEDEASSGHGFVAILDSGRPGKTLGLRTDIDALPVQESEQNLKADRLVRSENEGAMHACGHDAHMAILMTAMEYLAAHSKDWKGRIAFVFEEAEETGAGIGPLVRLVKNFKVDAFYGNHVLSSLEVGKVGIQPGPVMAAVSRIDFKVIGKGGHGSRPDLSVNPIAIGVDILNSINIAWNNQLDVEETVTLGITQFNSGQAFNVFEDDAHIGGSIRYFNEAEGEKAHALVMKIARSVAEMHGGSIEETELSGPITVPVVNDLELATIAQEALDKVYPGAVATDVNWFASETFANLGKVAPYVFTLVGIKNEDLGSGAEHHNEYFDLDDQALKYGAGSMIQFALDYLGE